MESIYSKAILKFEINPYEYLHGYINSNTQIV